MRIVPRELKSLPQLKAELEAKHGTQISPYYMRLAALAAQSRGVAMEKFGKWWQFSEDAAIAVERELANRGILPSPDGSRILQMLEAVEELQRRHPEFTVPKNKITLLIRDAEALGFPVHREARFVLLPPETVNAIDAMLVETTKVLPVPKVGDVFGRLTIIEIHGEGDKARCLCACECGKQSRPWWRSLHIGRTKSCGCLRFEATRKHGMYKTPLYSTWQSMNQRCNNPKANHYADYGGRGISVCERWRDFANFYADMSPKPSNKHQLERIDNNGNYCPENCRWATIQEQHSNTRRNVFLTARGETRTLSEWSRITGISNNMLRYRLKKGWSADRILDTPVKGKHVA